MAAYAPPPMPDLTRCREFVLDNGERVLWRPNSEPLLDIYQNAHFIGQTSRWNPLPFHNNGQGTARIARELQASEKGTVLSPEGPNPTAPTAPTILYGVPIAHQTLYTVHPSVPEPGGRGSVPGGIAPDELGVKDTGRLFPVVSITTISAEFKTRLLQANIDEAGEDDYFLVLVEDLAANYEEETSPESSTATTTSGAFQNKSPLECALLLRKLRQEGSDLNFESFVILDARSLVDDTVLMVYAPRADESALTDDEDEDGDEDDEAREGERGEVTQGLRIWTLRAEMGLVNSRMGFWAVEGDISEDIRSARELGDRVFRESRFLVM
ncbi:hypothetical protein LTR53_007828 [Teratosphaeriaceae sp. CCFEE 6253]|nr:hypothetical protein LTR53_007828 [Teratosphaeriaceae sp. CCFEE 6253]